MSRRDRGVIWRTTAPSSLSLPGGFPVTSNLVPAWLVREEVMRPVVAFGARLAVHAHAGWLVPDAGVEQRLNVPLRLRQGSQPGHDRLRNESVTELAVAPTQRGHVQPGSHRADLNDLRMLRKPVVEPSPGHDQCSGLTKNRASTAASMVR